MNVTFSVITPCYDSVGFIDRYFRSLFNQIEKSFEIVICLTPRSPSSVDSEVDCIKAAHAKYFKGINNLTIAVDAEKAGPGQARNLAANYAKGVWLAFLDIDDIWAPEKLVKMLIAINKHGNVDLFHHGALVNNEVYGVVFDDSNKSVNATFDSLLYDGNQIANSSVILKKDIFLNCGGYDTSVKACEDWELWLRITSHGHATYYLNEPLMTYYVHGNNMHYLKPDDNLYWITLIFNNYAVIDNDLKQSLKNRFFSRLLSRVAVEHFRIGNRWIGIKYSVKSLKLEFFSKYSWSALFTTVIGIDLRKLYWTLNRFNLQSRGKK